MAKSKSRQPSRGTFYSPEKLAKIACECPDANIRLNAVNKLTLMERTRRDYLNLKKRYDKLEPKYQRLIGESINDVRKARNLGNLSFGNWEQKYRDEYTERLVRKAKRPGFSVKKLDKFIGTEMALKDTESRYVYVLQEDHRDALVEIAKNSKYKDSATQALEVIDVCVRTSEDTFAYMHYLSKVCIDGNAPEIKMMALEKILGELDSSRPSSFVCGSFFIETMARFQEAVKTLGRICRHSHSGNESIVRTIAEYIMDNAPYAFGKEYFYSACFRTENPEYGKIILRTVRDRIKSGLSTYYKKMKRNIGAYEDIYAKQSVFLDKKEKMRELEKRKFPMLLSEIGTGCDNLEISELSLEILKVLRDSEKKNYAIAEIAQKTKFPEIKVRAEEILKERNEKIKDSD